MHNTHKDTQNKVTKQDFGVNLICVQAGIDSKMAILDGFKGELRHKGGAWVGICGELGADLELTERFTHFNPKFII